MMMMLQRPAAWALPAALMMTKMRVARCSDAKMCTVGTPGRDFEVTHARVVTYNVRRFKAEDGTSTVPAIGSALAELQPDLIALNEVDTKMRPEALPDLAEKLGGFFFAFFGHVRGQYGNALLSKYPIVEIRETHLRGGTEVSFPAGMRRFNGEIAKEGEFHRIARGLMECDIEIPSGSHGPATILTVAVTHLDHINEGQRQVQLEHVVEALGSNAKRSLVVGDFNLLTRSDYTEHEWATLENRAATNGWAGPAPGCVDLLLTAGFVDAFVQTRGEVPLARRPNPTEDPIFSAHVGHPLYRIDYCFVSRETGLVPVRAKVHHDIQLSDHFPVSFDFHIASCNARP